MKIAPLGLAGGRSYDRTNSQRTPTMKESQLLREKTTSSVFVSTCSNAVYAQFHWLEYPRNTRPCDVVCLQSKHFRSIAPPAKIYARDRSRSRWNMKHFRQTARGCLLHHIQYHSRMSRGGCCGMTNADWLISPPAAQILPGLLRERVRMEKIKETERVRIPSLPTFFCKSRDSWRKCMREAFSPQSFQGSLGVVRPLGASRLGAGLAHTPLKWLGEAICTCQ